MLTSSLWWWLVGLALAAELLTGGIYLLMLALGLSAGAAAAHLGFSLPAQMGMAAFASVFAVLLCHRLRQHKGAQLPAGADPALNLDIGETVHVPEWASDGTARVTYRGSLWTVALRAGTLPTPGLYRVVALQGNRLLVDKA